MAPADGEASQAVAEAISDEEMKNMLVGDPVTIAGRAQKHRGAPTQNLGSYSVPLRV